MTRLLTDPAAYQDLVCTTLPFGDGHAAARIVEALDRIQPDPTHEPTLPRLTAVG